MADFLSNLHPPEGSTKGKRRLGRGLGSGLGKTSGKGQKGQKARHPGNFKKMGFQGGQTPMQRRLPKRGFRNAFAVEISAVNIGLIAKRFDAGAAVDLESLKKVGLIEASADKVKILGTGEIDKALKFNVHGMSAGAKEKIEKAGGTVQLIEAPKKKGPKDREASKG